MGTNKNFMIGELRGNTERNRKQRYNNIRENFKVAGKVIF